MAAAAIRAKFGGGGLTKNTILYDVFLTKNTILYDKKRFYFYFYFVILFSRQQESRPNFTNKGKIK